MAGFRDIMNMAQTAKIDLINDREQGEQEFSELLKKYPHDGMIFFKRGEAYEKIGLMKLACDDFTRAETYFPMETWKETARNAKRRVC